MRRYTLREELDSLAYSYAYLYGYHLEGPPCALTARTGIEREEGVSRMNVVSQLRGEVCGRCGSEADSIQPLFDLDMASSLIPMRYSSLKTYLSKHSDQYPARYMLTYGHRRIRMLTASEIKEIRFSLLRGPGRASF